MLSVARVAITLALVALVAACDGGTASIPPCNAWVFLWGAADLTLDCPAKTAIPILSSHPP